MRLHEVPEPAHRRREELLHTLHRDPHRFGDVGVREVVPPAKHDGQPSARRKRIDRAAQGDERLVTLEDFVGARLSGEIRLRRDQRSMSARHGAVAQVLECTIARRDAQVRSQRASDGQAGAITP